MFTVIIVVATTALRSTTLLYDLALDRVEQARQFRAVQALAYYGAVHCKQMSDTKQDEGEQEEYHATFAQWPQPAGNYQAELLITPQNNQYTITAKLSSDEKPIATIQCTISTVEGRWDIENWTLL